MKLLFALLVLGALPVHAAVNLQTCQVQPSSSVGLEGCPMASVKFAPVSPSTLVRSDVGGTEGWRAFGTLTSGDLVIADSNPSQRVPLGSLTVAKVASTPPPTNTSPPAQTPPTAPASGPAQTCTSVSPAVTWTCTVSGTTQTCTAPAP